MKLIEKVLDIIYLLLVDPYKVVKPKRQWKYVGITHETRREVETSMGEKENPIIKEYPLEKLQELAQANFEPKHVHDTIDICRKKREEK